MTKNKTRPDKKEDKCACDNCGAKINSYFALSMAILGKKALCETCRKESEEKLEKSLTTSKR